MVAFSILASLLVASPLLSAHALPLQKRIAQVIADSTAQWEKACDAAGGGQQCNPLSVTAFTTLLAAAGNCDQQNAADNMIDLAKTLNNDPNMIKFTQIFVQQPRNTPNSLAVPYCNTAPHNPELAGLFQCQYQGANQASFVGGLKVGAPSTIPFGLSAPVSPAGSCPANTAGPIADGSQLVDLTQDPGIFVVPLAPAASNAVPEVPAISSSSTPAPSPSASPSLLEAIRLVVYVVIAVCFWLLRKAALAGKFGVAVQGIVRDVPAVAGEELSPSTPPSTTLSDSLPLSMASFSDQEMVESMAPVPGTGETKPLAESFSSSPTRHSAKGSEHSITMNFAPGSKSHVSFGANTMYCDGGNGESVARLE